MHSIFYNLKFEFILDKGSFTYYVISRGGGGFQMLTVDYGGGGGGGGGVAVDYVIKILIFTLIPI